jgi:hypothetical protein
MDFMQFIAELDMDQAHVLAWANAQVAASRACDVQLSRFGDPEIKSGVFLLRLMAAVAPEAIDTGMIKPGLTPFDQQLNAKLAISTSHKMGARVFCGWHDIVEARPKLMLSMMAAVMSVAFRTKTTSKGDVLKQVTRARAQLEAVKASDRLSRRGSSVASILSVASAANTALGRANSMIQAGNPNQLLDSIRRGIQLELDLDDDSLPPPPRSARQRIGSFFSGLAGLLTGRRPARAHPRSSTGFKLRLSGNPARHSSAEELCPSPLKAPLKSPAFNVRALGFDPSKLPKAPPVPVPLGAPPPATARGGAPFAPSPRCRGGANPEPRRAPCLSTRESLVLSRRDSAAHLTRGDSQVLVSPRLSNRDSTLEQRRLSTRASQTTMDRVMSLHI